MKLDLGCGATTPNGWAGVDCRALPAVTFVVDLDVLPWPFPSGTVEALRAHHLVEHVDPARGHFLEWMDEAWRVLVPGGSFEIVHPDPHTDEYLGDPTHCNPCIGRTWEYFDPECCPDHTYLWEIYRPRPWVLTRCQQRGIEWHVLLHKREEA